MTTLVGLLGSLGVLAVGGTLATTALAEPRGPLVALEKAHDAAARASARAQSVDRGVAAAVGAPAASSPSTGGQSRGDRNNAADGRDSGGPTTKGERELQQLASLDPEDQATIRYDPARHRDPFRPPTVGASAASSRTPLERYDIGQLKLVGVVWEDQGASAMVEDSGGKGYIVTAGTPIGSSGGVVKSVEPRRILIEESITNFYGNKEPREVVMKLPEEDRSP